MNNLIKLEKVWLELSKKTKNDCENKSTNNQLLKNISIEINKGNSIGIMGKNGSGKSTLLRLIAGVYKPTSGRIKLVEDIASIIELTGGIKPSLTGRDNVYLLAGLHGMNNSEIKQSLPEVVAFSELGNLIDRQVRTYSSGMIARLAFSIVSVLESEIYLLDETLAVGDEKFKRKCYEKILEWKNKGKTLIIVSHSFDEVMLFCNQVYWMENGIIKNIFAKHEFNRQMYEKLSEV